MPFHPQPLIWTPFEWPFSCTPQFLRDNDSFVSSQGWSAYCCRLWWCQDYIILECGRIPLPSEQALSSNRDYIRESLSNNVKRKYKWPYFEKYEGQEILNVFSVLRIENVTPQIKIHKAHKKTLDGFIKIFANFRTAWDINIDSKLKRVANYRNNSKNVVLLHS